MPEGQMQQETAIAAEPMIAVEPVRKSIRVKAGVERTYRVFTEEMDSWWPRTHHIGRSPMKRVVVEGARAARFIRSRRMERIARGVR